jgi:hypothetical protein
MTEAAQRSALVQYEKAIQEELTPSLRAFIDASVHQGFARVEDFNGSEQKRLFAQTHEGCSVASRWR